MGGPRSWLERRSKPASPSEAGFTTAELLLAVGLTLLIFVWVANLAVYLYGRGVVRSAIDEAARAGSRVGADSATVCQERANQVLANLIGGSMGRELAVSCAEEDGVVRARADVVFRAWLPPVPDWHFQATGAVIKEQVP